MSKYLIFASIGFELVGIMLGAIYLGQAIDSTYGTKGIALIVLMFAGLASWLTHLIFLLKRIQKDSDNSEEPKA
ncbi:MAG: AtpZ/AtpI family protein [Proteobacteria bacterium]|nr:MAG: AtpZ/AtpI family protein [Pseudomonadota bacterium]